MTKRRLPWQFSINQSLFQEQRWNQLHPVFINAINEERVEQMWTFLFFSCLVVSNSRPWPYGLQHASPRPSLSPRVAQTRLLSRWCHPTNLSLFVLFSCPLSFPAVSSFPVSWLFTSGGQSIWALALASVLPMNSQWLISFRADRFYLLAVQRTLMILLQHHSSKALIPQRSTFFMVQLSHPYMITGNHSSDYMDLCG